LRGFLLFLAFVGLLFIFIAIIEIQLPGGFGWVLVLLGLQSYVNSVNVYLPLRKDVQEFLRVNAKVRGVAVLCIGDLQRKVRLSPRKEALK